MSWLYVPSKARKGSAVNATCYHPCISRQLRRLDNLAFQNVLKTMAEQANNECSHLQGGMGESEHHGQRERNPLLPLQEDVHLPAGAECGT